MFGSFGANNIRTDTVNFVTFHHNHGKQAVDFDGFITFIHYYILYSGALAGITPVMLCGLLKYFLKHPYQK